MEARQLYESGNVQRGVWPYLESWNSGPILSSRIHQPTHEYEGKCGESFEQIAPERAVSYHEVDKSDDTRDSKQNGRYRIVLHLDMLRRLV